MADEEASASGTVATKPPTSSDRTGRVQVRQLRRQTTRECSKPMLPPEERACFKCGKPGHVARRCPNEEKPKAGAIKAVSMSDKGRVTKISGSLFR